MTQNQILENPGERKEAILKAVLVSGEASVSMIQKAAGIPRSSLNHHLQMLAKHGIITQKKRGKELINQVNPVHIQLLRKRFDIKTGTILISGYTLNPEKPDPNTLEVPQRAIDILARQGIEIEKTIAFTTPLAAAEAEKAGIKRPDKEEVFDFNIYLNHPETIKDSMEKIITTHLPESWVIIDLTPLTKLFSIVGLSLARHYHLKAVYHAGEKLISF